MALPYKFKAQTITDEGRTTQTALDEIKEWLTTTSLPQLQYETIALFLVACRNEIKATQDAISAYFRMKSAAPELFKDRDIDRPELQKAMKTIICSSLPSRMDDNTVIHFFKLNDTNYKNFDLVVNIKLAFMLLDISQREDPPSSLVVIMDMQGTTLMHLTCIKLGAVKKFIEFVQEAMPLRIQSIHILNTNYMFEKLLAVVKLFIKDELLAMVKAHQPSLKMEEFYRDCVPASCLPKDYGGELPSVEELNQRTIEQFTELKEFFQAEENLISSYCNK